MTSAGRFFLHGLTIAALSCSALLGVDSETKATGRMPPAAGSQRDDAAARAETARQFRKSVTIDHTRSDLSKALLALERDAGLTFVTNWPALRNAGADRDTKVSLLARKIPAHEGLELILHVASAGTITPLGYEVRNGYIYVSTLEEIRANVEYRVYDIERILRYFRTLHQHADVTGARARATMPLGHRFSRPCTPEQILTHLDRQIESMQSHLKLSQREAQPRLAEWLHGEIARVTDQRDAIKQFVADDNQVVLARRCYIEVASGINLSDVPATAYTRLRQFRAQQDTAWLEAINRVIQRVNAAAKEHRPMDERLWQEIRHEMEVERARQMGLLDGWRIMMETLYHDQPLTPEAEDAAPGWGKPQTVVWDGEGGSGLVFTVSGGPPQLTDLIQDVCGRPEDWKCLGGPSDVQYLSHFLIARTTPDNHQQIKDLLAQIEQMISEKSEKTMPQRLQELIDRKRAEAEAGEKGGEDDTQKN